VYLPILMQHVWREKPRIELRGEMYFSCSVAIDSAWLARVYLQNVRGKYNDIYVVQVHGWIIKTIMVLSSVTMPLMLRFHERPVIFASWKCDLATIRIRNTRIFSTSWTMIRFPRAIAFLALEIARRIIGSCSVIRQQRAGQGFSGNRVF